MNITEDSDPTTNASHRLPCLYCGDTSGSRDREHVLQAALGGSLCLPDDVCKVCNNGILSSLDGSFASYLRDIEYRHHPDAGGGRDLLRGNALRWRDESGVWIDLWINSRHQPVVPPQIILINEAEFQLHLDAKTETEWTQGRDMLVQELDDPTTSYKITIVDSCSPPVQPALVRSAQGKYLVRAADLTSGTDWLTRAKSGGISGMLRALSGAWSVKVTEQPMVHGTVPTRMGDVARAAAKVALNFVCAISGPHIARHTALDPLRRFVLGGDAENPDGGFVFKLSAPETIEQAFARDGHHTIVLLPNGRTGTATVYLLLWQQLHAQVELVRTPGDSPISRDDLVVALFDYRSRTHQILRCVDDPIAFGNEFPFHLQG